MSNFRVGDRVRRINFNNFDKIIHLVGDVGTVTGIDGHPNRIFVDGMVWRTENAQLVTRKRPEPDAPHTLADCVMALALADLIYRDCAGEALEIWLRRLALSRLREIVQEGEV